MWKIKLLPGLPLSRADRAPLEARRQRRPTVAFSSLPLSGQASLEMTVGLIGVFILLFGALNVFLWANKDIVKRQEYYEHAPDDADINGDKYGGKYDYGRVEAADFLEGNDAEPVLLPESIFDKDKLEIFKTK